MKERGREGGRERGREERRDRKRVAASGVEEQKSKGNKGAVKRGGGLRGGNG